MDGLECSEINLRYVRDNLLRVDAEYYQKDSLILETVLESMAGKTISAHNGKTDCSAFYPSITGYYNDDRNNIPFLRVNEIVDGLVVISDKTVFLPEEILKANSKTIALAYPGDIIIAKGGNTLAKVGLVTDEFSVYATCRDVIILRTGEMTDLNKFYLWAYLHGSFGQKLMWRSASQTGQPHLTLKSIDGIHVPEYSMALQQAIEDLYNRSVYFKQLSQHNYDDAMDILEKALDMSQVPEDPVSIKNYSDSFIKTGRLDSEYYQPKYDFYYSKIVEYSEGYFRIGDVAEYVFTGEYSEEYWPKGNNRKFYIRGTNMKNGRIITDENYFVDPAKHQKHVSAGDIVTTRVGTIGLFAEIDNNLDGAICSDNVICFRLPDCYKPDVYTLLLNSKPIHELIDRLARGSVQQRLNQETLRDVILPILTSELQKDLSERIQISFAFQIKSDELLAHAKKAVEMAIEQGEDTALAWLKERTGE